MQVDLDLQRFVPSEEAYAEMTALWNALNPEWPRDPKVWAQRDLPDVPARVLARRAGRLVGGGDSTRSTNAAERDVYDLTLFARPDVGGASALEPLYRAVRDNLSSRARVLLAYIPDSRPWLLSFLRAQGFRSVEQTAYSRFLAQGVLPDGDLVRRALSAGYEVTTLAAMEAAHAPDWRRRYWELHVKCLADVPNDVGFQPPTFEAFSKNIDDPDTYNLDATFVGLFEGSFVGLCRLSTWSGIPEWAFNDLTGTLPAHRRRGLAALLKVLALGYAHEHGIESVVSLNDVNNPMLQLNLKLGFETLHIQHTMRLDLSPPASATPE